MTVSSWFENGSPKEQVQGAGPFDTVFLSGQGRERKLVTEGSKPVGSGESIYRIGKK